MRFSSKSAVILLSMVLAGCSSRGMTIDDLMTQLSYETTASVSQPTPADDDQGLPATALAIAPVNAPAIQTASLIVPSPRKASPSRSRQKIYSQRFRDAKPMSFGKVTPQHHPVHGVDVSRWQGSINWNALRANGANFVYIKSTDGGDHLDPAFRKNWNDASAAGLKHGAYHFFYWCRTGAEQADWFIRNVPKEAGALPPVLDVEWNAFSQCKKRPPRDQVLAKMRAFLNKVEKHYGQRPIIYTAPDFYRDNLQGEFTDYPFWLRSVAAHPSKVYPGRKWVLWQYSGTGLSKGLDEKIDLNVFNGSEKDWHNWVARNTR